MINKIEAGGITQEYLVIKLNELIEVVNNPMYSINMVRCPECNILMGHDDNCPKIAREANGCDNDGNPVIYGLGGGKEPEKLVCKFIGDHWHLEKCPACDYGKPTKPVECQHEWFYSSPPHRDQRCKKCEEHRIEPPDNLELVIDDFFGVRYNQYVVDCWKEPLADKIREWIKCELKGMKKKQSDVLGMPIECNEGYNQCLEDITGKLCGE